MQVDAAGDCLHFWGLSGVVDRSLVLGSVAGERNGCRRGRESESSRAAGPVRNEVVIVWCMLFQIPRPRRVWDTLISERVAEQ